MIPRSFIAASVLTVTALQPAGLYAVSSSFDSLLRNSPFGGQAVLTPGGSQNPDGPTPLEFRGVLVDKGEQFFSLYETSTRSSFWVGINDPSNAFKVQTYDEAKGSVTVEYQGRTLTLPLKLAKVLAQAVNVPSMMPNGNPQGNDPSARMPPVVRTAEENARLATIAEEIRRRRALRQQATPSNPTPAGGPPGLPVPPPAPKRN